MDERRVAERLDSLLCGEVKKGVQLLAAMDVGYILRYVVFQY